MKSPTILIAVLACLLLITGCARKVEPIAQPQPNLESQEDENLENQTSEVESKNVVAKHLEAEASVVQRFSNDEKPDLDESAYRDELAESEDELAEIHTIEISDNWKRLGKNEIWVDFKAKQVMIGGYICLERGLLEMFVCPVGTKEHESIIAALAPAVEMHAALLAIGAEPGKPSSWNEETGFQPPTGSKIEIEVRWLDEETEQVITRDSRQMIQNTQTGQAMKNDWIFAGSQTYEDPDTGEKYYYANSGEMICVSNFPSSAIDISVESSSDNESLLFQVYEDNVPPLGTKVYLILTPAELIEAGNEN